MDLWKREGRRNLEELREKKNCSRDIKYERMNVKPNPK